MENVLTFFEIQEHEFHKIIESTTTFVKSYFENTMSQSIKNYYSYLEELDSNQEFYLMISAEYKNNSEISKRKQLILLNSYKYHKNIDYSSQEWIRRLIIFINLNDRNFRFLITF